jgi:hypothetical protein
VAKTTGPQTGRIARGLAAAVVAAALVGTTASVANADGKPAPGTVAKSDTPKPAKRQAASKSASALKAATPAQAQLNPLFGAERNGNLFRYDLNFAGGIEARTPAGEHWEGVRFATQTNLDGDEWSDGVWQVTYGNQLYYSEFGMDPTLLGGGWGIYNNVFSPDNIGGGSADDLLARDTAGVLWLYLGYNTGKLTQRYRVGGGWGVYTQITGKGDLTNDGKPDVVARDGSGVLWLHKGTGNYKAPFSPRTRIGGGWNMFNHLVSVGDVDTDVNGRADLVARDTAGALWLYPGTGNAAAPFGTKKKIGTSGWNTYRLIF